MKNKKRRAFALSVLIALLCVTGCERSDIGKTGRAIQGGDGKYEVVCIDGVEYIMFLARYRGGITTKIEADGTISTCKY